MGVVYLARDVRLDRRVAIKFLSGHLSRDAEARARFIQEARAASALDHLNICTIYEIDDTPEGQTFMVMAHYDGVTLDRRIEQSPLAIGEAIGIVAQVADGLARAHARGIAHRDIKPSNVMLTTDGVVKILDFGLAKIAGSDGFTQTGTSVGTPAFMAPEQVTGGIVDHRADLWAMGGLLQMLLTGRPPFERESMPATIYAILHQDPERSPPRDRRPPSSTPSCSAACARIPPSAPPTRRRSPASCAACCESSIPAAPRPRAPRRSPSRCRPRCERRRRGCPRDVARSRVRR